MRHSKLEPPSVEVKLKSALDELLGSDGVAVIDVSGAVVSTVHVYVCGVAAPFPAASVAWTSNVWEPSASEEYLFGLEQAAKEPPSSRHWKVTPPSLALKSKVAPVALVGSAGAESIDVTGRVRSTVTLTMSSPVFEPTSVATARSAAFPS